MTRFLTTTRVDSSNVLQCLVGNFHKGQDSVILWGYSDRLELYREEPHGGLLLFHKQHTHDKLLKLGYLLGQPDGLQNEDVDMPVLLFASHRLAVLRFDQDLHRFITVHAICLRSYGIPALSQHLLLHVDPQTWTTALSPDGLALVVFLRGKDRSLSSLLSEPVRPDMSLANRQLVAHRHHAHTRVNAITFADLPTGHGMSTRYLYVLAAYKDVVRSADLGELPRGAPYRWRGEVHRVLAFSMDGTVKLQVSETVHSTPFAEALSATADDASASIYQLIPCGQDAGVLHFRAGELKKIAPVQCSTKNAFGDTLALLVQRYPVSMTGLESPQQPLEDTTSVWMESEELVLVPPTAVCSAAGVTLLWTAYGLHRVSFSGNTMLMTKIMPKGAGDEKSCPLWLQSPRHMTALPSDALLMVSEGHGARVVEDRAGDAPRVTQVIRLLPRLTSAFTTGRSRLSQKQVIGLSPGVFRANETTPGQVHLLHGSRVVDCLYESPPEYPGVTGIFPVSLTSQDDTTAAVVISFASGSRALTTGDTFSDITESIGLDTEAQTLTAATISPGYMAQVTSSAIRLCPLHALQASAGDEMDSEGTPRKRPSSMFGEGSLSGCGLEQSMAGAACSSEQDGSDSSSSRRGSTMLSRPSYEAQSRSCSSWDGLPVVDEAATWRPPGNASVTCAVVLPGMVIVASAQPHALIALVLSHSGSPCGRGIGMGKRKRSESLPQLTHAASTALAAEISCVHAIERHEGAHCSSVLCMAGLHGAALVLYMLQADNRHGRQWSFQQLCSMHAPPSRFCHSWDSGSPVEDVPGSVLLLAGTDSAPSVQALVGWRSGQVMQVDCNATAPGDAEAVEETAGRMSSMLQLSSPGRSAASKQHEDMQTDVKPVTGLRVLCVRRMGSLPVQLTSLKSLAPALCMSEHIALGSFSPGSGRLMLEPLACHSILHAAPLLCLPDVSTASEDVRWQLLSASEDGTLRLLQLARDSAAQAQTADLPPNCELMALSEPSNRLGVVRSATLHQPAVLECIELDALFRQSSVVSGSELGFQEEIIHGPSCSLPILPGLQSKEAWGAMCIAALIGPAFCDSSLEWEATYAVGGRADGSGSSLGWLQVVSFNPQSWDASLRFCSYFQDPVAAVTQYRRDNCMLDLLMASVGSRLVCLRPDCCPSEIAAQQSDSLSTCDWIRTREPLSAISVAPGSGLIAAVGPSQSAVIYRYSTEEGFEIVCADPVSHNPVACLPLNGSADDALQEFLLLDRSGLLLKQDFQEHERRIECNMQSEASFHTRTPCVSLCYGSMRREDLGMPESPGSLCMTACSRDGSVVEVLPVPGKDWCMLAAVQSALRRDRVTAPLSWAEHGRVRHWTGTAKQTATGILDGDFLAQLEHLPHAVVQQLLNGIDRADIASMLGKADTEEALDAAIACCRSVESVLQVLDRTLSVLWPPP